ncbi:MAG: DMT family transporter [Ruthenibacterium sp.]
MNEKEKKNNLLWWASRVALLMVGAIWGSSLVVVKSSVEMISPNLLIACRFTIAFIVMALVFFKKFRLLNKEYVICGAIIGACLFVAYWIQTLGITLAMPGKSAFLSSIYCVIVPFVYWIIGGRRPAMRNLMAALFCVTGIMLSSITKGFTIAPGDMLALLSGVFFAIHIAVVGKYGGKKDAVLITILQFGFCAGFAWIATFIFEGTKLQWSAKATGGVLYLALACTALALLLQNLGQKYASPASASILMSTESVFGVVFSVIFMGEIMTPKLVIGFILIFLSVLISEIPFNPQKSNFRLRKTDAETLKKIKHIK